MLLKSHQTNVSWCTLHSSRLFAHCSIRKWRASELFITEKSGCVVTNECGPEIRQNAIYIKENRNSSGRSGRELSADLFCFLAVIWHYIPPLGSTSNARETGTFVMYGTQFSAARGSLSRAVELCFSAEIVQFLEILFKTYLFVC